MNCFFSVITVPGTVSEQFMLFFMPVSSWTFLARPMEERMRKSKALLVKLIDISMARSRVSGHILIPMPDKIYSLTLPTPGIFLIGSLAIKSYTASSENSKYVYPSGLLISEQILASILLHAIPQLAVILVASRICLRIFWAMNSFPNSSFNLLVFKYSVISRLASSRPTSSKS